MGETDNRVPKLSKDREPEAVARSRRLRRDMTEGERRLWRDLRVFKEHYGLHVRRQVPLGGFVVDFAILSAAYVVEVDGEHHFTPEGLRRDVERDAILAAMGYRVRRLNTGELSGDFYGCIRTILADLGLL